MTRGEDYLGFKVAGFVVAILPAVIRSELDIDTMTGRLLLALCGGAGALLALFGDRPKNWPDAVFRIVGGVISCFLFGPWVAKRFGMGDTMDGIIFVFGGIGVVSWYFIGSGTKVLIGARESGGLGKLIKNVLAQWLRVDPDKLSSPAKPPEKPPDKPAG